MCEKGAKSNREVILREIIASEWAMFDRVQNIGGRASCQDDFKTFLIMRHSQLNLWDTPVLESYLNDHRVATCTGANLIEQKYAYMMQYTDPSYYNEKLAPFLPHISEAKRSAVEAIAAIYEVWYRQVRNNYPFFTGRGRPETDEAGEGMTSVNTYLRGELLSYSENTLSLLLSMIKRMNSHGENQICAIYNEIARSYGYASLDDAENLLKARRKAFGHE